MSETRTGQIPESAENISRGGFSLFAGPFYRLFLAPDKMTARYAFVTAGKHMNGAGNLHGGLLMSFADIAMSRTARDAAGVEDCCTVSLTADFIAAAQEGEMIEAHVRVTRRTRTLVFQSADIVSGGRILMVASGLWKIG